MSSDFSNSRIATFSCRASDNQDYIDTTPRTALLSELKDAMQRTTFSSLPDRINHESLIARIKNRLNTGSTIDRIVGVLTTEHPQLVASGELMRLERMMTLSLTSKDIDDLWYVCQHTTSNHVLDILTATYET